MSDEEGTVFKCKDADPNNWNRKHGDEWGKLCHCAESGLTEIQSLAVQGQLEGSQLRSIYWQLLLGSLPVQPALWISLLRQQRESYRLIHQRLSVDPRQANPDDNPLSQSNSSIWHQFFCDKELRALIRQDVERTFPTLEIFRSESIQSTMVNILFCYAREHPEICYRQGMHEVLAVLLFVIQGDQKCLIHARGLAPVSDRAVEILDPAWLEEDVYWLFCKLMSHLAVNYKVKNTATLLNGHFQPTGYTDNGEGDSQSATESELASRLAHIRHVLLRQFDEELYLHLKNLDIPFQAFGIRWLRLLFAQEFPLSDLLYIWDAVFSEGDNLVNYIVVSMLSSIRKQLLNEDDTGCLMLLMRYPSGVDVKLVVETALHLWNPKKYSSLKEEKKKVIENYADQRRTTDPPSTTPSRFKKLSFWSQRKDRSVSQSYTPKTKVTFATAVEEPSSRLNKTAGIQAVVEGFNLNDPMIVKAELQHLYNLISHIHLHLTRYHAALEHSLPSNTSPAGREALEGVKQLCSQLSHSLPKKTTSFEVETASEAKPAPTVEVDNNLCTPGDSLRGLVRELPLEAIKHTGTIRKQDSSYNLPLENPPKIMERNVKLHLLYCKLLRDFTA